MAGQIPFIGRQDELLEIVQAIQEADRRQVLCLQGPGGVGKTRLLEEIHKQYLDGQEATLVITDIIDFDDQALRYTENVELNHCTKVR